MNMVGCNQHFYYYLPPPTFAMKLIYDLLFPGADYYLNDEMLGNGIGKPDLINDILRPKSNLWNMVKRPNMWPRGRVNYFIYLYYTSAYYYFTVQNFDNKYIKYNLQTVGKVIKLLISRNCSH